MMPTTPWTLHKTADEPVRHSPLFGQHCAEVLREELGIGDEELRVLIAAGVTGHEFLGLKTVEAPAKL